MSKFSPKIIAALVAGTVALTALTPVAFANHNNSGERPNADNDRQGERGDHRGGHRFQGRAGGFIPLICSDEAGERLENALTHIPENLTLTAEQEVLFDDLKTAALGAQTQFADSCVQPVRPQEGEAAPEDFNPADGMAMRSANMQAMATAMQDVIPTVEAFFDSLTDEQKQALRDARADHRGDHDGESRPERGHHN